MVNIPLDKLILEANQIKNMPLNSSHCRIGPCRLHNNVYKKVLFTLLRAQIESRLKLRGGERDKMEATGGNAFNS